MTTSKEEIWYIGDEYEMKFARKLMGVLMALLVIPIAIGTESMTENFATTTGHAVLSPGNHNPAHSTVTSEIPNSLTLWKLPKCGWKCGIIQGALSGSLPKAVWNGLTRPSVCQ